MYHPEALKSALYRIKCDFFAYIAGVQIEQIHNDLKCFCFIACGIHTSIFVKFENTKFNVKSVIINDIKCQDKFFVFYKIFCVKLYS